MGTERIQPRKTGRYLLVGRGYLHMKPLRKTAMISDRDSSSLISTLYLEEQSDARPPILFKYSRKNNINRNINPCKNIGEIIGGENIEEDLSQSSVSKTD